MQRIRQLLAVAWVYTVRGWQRFWPWYKGAGRNLQIGIGCGALIAVCVVCGGLSAASQAGKGSTSTNAALADQIQPTATTSKPAATNTPSGPRPISGALLGAKVSDFTAKFGSPIDTANELRSYQTTIQGQAAFIRTMLVAPGDSSRVRFIDVNSGQNGAYWTDATAEAIAKTLAPADAIFVKDLEVADFGTEHVYKSADLAATFPTSSFTDQTTDAAVDPGTFYISCGNQNESQGGCSLQLGDD